MIDKLPDGSPSAALAELLREVAVMPVITISDAALAVPLAEALLAGGIGAIEVTLRTKAALPAIEAIARQVPQMLIGAGTILSPDDGRRASAAGSRFLVSPGLTATLAKADLGSPLLPGVATASEAMQAREWGFHFLKLFPAESVGGLSLLKSWSGPLQDLVFCPTGGVDPVKARAYLTQKNVICVGGSWIASEAAIEGRDWRGITERARETTTLRG